MGLRYRKSVNLGLGFRVNISKSGIGYSWGVSGARLTKTATGRNRATLSIPSTGISYVNESGGKKNGNRKSSAPTQPIIGSPVPIRSIEPDTVSAPKLSKIKAFIDCLSGLFHQSR